MKRTIRIAIAQINTTVGDFTGNAAKVLDYIQKAQRGGAQLIVFPELTITGYPPEDLLLKEKFHEVGVLFFYCLLQVKDLHFLLNH